jgi:hypothetical protein
MTQAHDFERAWLERLRDSLEALAGQDVRRQVMRGSCEMYDTTPREEVIAWSQASMARLEALVDPSTARDVLLGCACHYPAAALEPIRAQYLETGDLDAAHRALQSGFESFLRDTLGLDEGQVDTVVDRGWGTAGVRQGNTIVATKIPKSGYLRQYLAESDREIRRQIYCHCPRVRDAVRLGIELSATYCYCGGGFYQNIWQTIVGQPVEIEIVESILQGGDVCSFAIHLPAHIP